MNAGERFKVFDAQRRHKAAAASVREQAEREALATVIPEAPRAEFLVAATVADCVVEVDKLPLDDQGSLDINPTVKTSPSYVRGNYAEKRLAFLARGKGSTRERDRRNRKRHLTKGTIFYLRGEQL